MNAKRQAFVTAYLTCFNATRAAEKAGYKHPRQQGSYLLTILDIQEEIKRRLSEKAMSADEVLSRLGEMARADISEFIGEQGVINWEAVKQNGCLVKKISHTKGHNSAIELYDAQAALALLGKHHRLFIEQHEFTKPIEVKCVGLDRLTDEELNILAELARRIRGDREGEG